MPHVGAGHLKMRISQEKEKEVANNLLAYSAWICARSAPPNFFSIKKRALRHIPLPNHDNSEINQCDDNPG